MRLKKTLIVLSFMAAQAVYWSVGVTALLCLLACLLNDEMPDLPKLWLQMLIGGFVVAAANQIWWRIKKRDYLGRTL